MIGGWDVGSGVVQRLSGRQFECGEDGADQVVCAELGMDEECVLADPAEARVGSVFTFEQGGGVSGAAELVVSKLSFQRIGNFKQTFFEYFVVIAAPSIASDAAFQF